jgi:hypothetical protein
MFVMPLWRLPDAPARLVTVFVASLGFIPIALHHAQFVALRVM